MKRGNCSSEYPTRIRRPSPATISSAMSSGRGRTVAISLHRIPVRSPDSRSCTIPDAVSRMIVVSSRAAAIAAHAPMAKPAPTAKAQTDSVIGQFTSSGSESFAGSISGSSDSTTRPKVNSPSLRIPSSSRVMPG